MKAEKVSNDYEKVTKRIAHFAYDYHNAIEKSLNINDGIAFKLSQFFYYPAQFMLKYNAIRRIQMLCMYLLLKASVSKFPIDDWSCEQNTELSERFARYYNTGDVVKLFLGYISSSSIIPLIYTLVSFIPSTPLNFSLREVFILVIFSVALISIFNFIQYTSLRGDLKDKFNSIKKEVAKLS